MLRRVEDLNLWTDYSINALAGRHFKPLSQLSNKGFDILIAVPFFNWIALFNAMIQQ